MRANDPELYGKYIATKGMSEEVIAFNDLPSEALKEARQKGYDDPLVSLSQNQNPHASEIF